MKRRRIAMGWLAVACATGAWAAPIHDAVQQRDLVTVRQVLQADPGAINLPTARGSTPLHIAAGLNDAAMIRMLVEFGAALETRTANRGYTPLHWAACVNATDAVRALLTAGADRNARAADGNTAIQLAQRNGAKDAVAALGGGATGKTGTTRTQAQPVTASVAPDALAAAEALRQAGKLQEAYTALGELLRQHPQDEAINHAYGLTCYALGDYSRAQLAFERVLQINKDNMLARLELGRTFLAAGRLQPAEGVFRDLLARNPPAAMRGDIETCIEQVRRSDKRMQWGGRVQVGIMNDDNVNVGPDSDVINIAPIVFGSRVFTELELGEESRPAADQGAFLSAGVNLVNDMGVRGDWVGTADAAWYENMYSERAQNEIRYLQGSAGLRRSWMRSMLMLPLRYGRIESGGKPLMGLVGVSPTWLWLQDDKGLLQWITSGGVEARDYDTLDDRDGTYVSIGEQLRYLAGARRHQLYVDGALFMDNTKVGVYRHVGQRVTVGASLNVRPNVACYGNARYQRTDYEEREILSPEVRADAQTQLTGGLRWMATAKWGVDINHQITDNSSTFELYQYERSVTTASGFCSF